LTKAEGAKGSFGPGVAVAGHAVDDVSIVSVVAPAEVDISRKQRRQKPTTTAQAHHPPPPIAVVAMPKCDGAGCRATKRLQKLQNLSNHPSPPQDVTRKPRAPCRLLIGVLIRERWEAMGVLATASIFEFGNLPDRWGDGLS
jgi:hypothetical protein